LEIIGEKKLATNIELVNILKKLMLSEYAKGVTFSNNVEKFGIEILDKRTGEFIGDVEFVRRIN